MVIAARLPINDPGIFTNPTSDAYGMNGIARATTLNSAVDHNSTGPGSP